MQNNRKVANQLAMMILVSFITQIFMLLKNSLLAANFGLGVELDAFNFTINISNFIYSFVGAGIATVLVPYLREKENKLAINTFISIVYLIAILLAVVMVNLRGPIVALLSGEADSVFFDMATRLLFFTIITGFLNSFVTLCSSILEFNGFFVRQKIMVLVNAILVVFFLLLGSSVTIYYFAGVTAFIAVLNVCVHIYFLRGTEFEYRLKLNVTNNTFRQMVRLMVPAVLSTGVYQLSVLVDTLIAARLPAGSISTLNYANAVVSMFNLLILANLTSYFYPRLVKKETLVESQKSLADYLLVINALLVLIVAMFFLVGKEGIVILYQRGSFTPEDTSLVFTCAIIYILSLPINGARDLLYKFFYIQKNTKSPFLNSILVSILNLIISVILSLFIGLYGVVLGTVISAYISLYAICKKFNHSFTVLFDMKSFINENLKIMSAMGLSLLLTFPIKSMLGFTNPFVVIILYGLLGTGIYIGVLFLTKSKLFKIEL